MKTNIYCDLKPERLVSQAVSLSQVLLFGLEEDLARELIRVIAPGSEAAFSAPDAAACLEMLEDAPVDIVFCSSKPEYCLPLLRTMKQMKRNTPVVVVSQEPEFDEWLDAMEAGAVDFVAAPFHHTQIHLILASHLTAARLAA